MQCSPKSIYHLHKEWEVSEVSHSVDPHTGAKYVFVYTSCGSSVIITVIIHHYCQKSWHAALTKVREAWFMSNHQWNVREKYAQCMSNVYPGADQRKYQSSASLAFVRGIHRSSVNSPRKWPVTRKMFPFDNVIMFFKSARGYIPWCSFTGIVYQRIRHG